MSGHARESFGPVHLDLPDPAGLGGSRAVIEVSAASPPRAPWRRPLRPNVLEFASRHPGSGISPGSALRRVRAAGIVILAVATATAALAVTLLGLSPLVVALLCWSAAELVVLQLQRHLDEMSSPGEALRRHATYAMAAACLLGVVTDHRAAALQVLYLLACLGAIQVSSGVLLRMEPVRRAIGIATVPSVLVVGDRSTAAQVVDDRAGLTSSHVVGVCLAEDSDRVTSVGGVPVLGGIDDVLALIESLKIHEVVLRPGWPLTDDWLRELDWSLERVGARLTLVTELRHTDERRVRVTRVGRSIVMGVTQGRPTGLVRHAKAATEALLASACFVATLPILIACVVAVRLDSPGPALFRQTRVRDRDRTFTMLKLRTMHVDAEVSRADLEECNEVGGGLFKIKADPRVTRVGRILRKSSLDELPQLLNVMRGQMALIGPRPALPSEVAGYDDRASRRLGVKPGLTGLWQVSGRSRLSWDESVSLDIDYVDNWRPGLDVRIAFETIRAVASKDGAY